MATWKTGIRNFVHHIVGNEAFERLIMLRQLGYWPHLRHPRSFNERISNIKLFNTPANAAVLADKYAVHAFVASKGLKHILNKVYFVGTDPEKIPFGKLPKKFVIRFTHSSGGTIFVQDKAKADVENIKRECRVQLAKRFGADSNESWYMQIEPRLMVEEMLEDKRHGIPPDYKIFVFGGKAGFIQVDYARFGDHKRRYYSPDWKAQDYTSLYPLHEPTPAPKNLKELLKIAETLGGDLPHARVDLYTVDDKDIKFGEITITHGMGWEPFTPTSADFELGRMWGRMIDETTKTKKKKA